MLAFFSTDVFLGPAGEVYGLLEGNGVSSSKDSVWPFLGQHNLSI